jgi:hypothetical protein
MDSSLLPPSLPGCATRAAGRELGFAGIPESVCTIARCTASTNSFPQRPAERDQVTGLEALAPASSAA